VSDQRSRRAKVDIYASILEVVRRFPGGGRITRISYGVGVPLDRLRAMVGELTSFGLIRKNVVDDETRYSVSTRGLEFLETYWKMNAFLEAFEGAPTRGLAAIVFTDVAGYTRLAQENERNALRLVEEQQAIVRAILPRFHGREVKTIGDAFLLEFTSALEASLCAIEIQRQMRDRNAGATGNGRIDLRIGIHVGDVERKGLDIVGDAVNIASRIQGAADPGGIVISRQVFDQVWNKLENHISEVGRKELKNVQLPVEIFRIDPPWLAPG
jgi:class 3 adenylate cyclase